MVLIRSSTLHALPGYHADWTRYPLPATDLTRITHAHMPTESIRATARAPRGVLGVPRITHGLTPESNLPRSLNNFKHRPRQYTFPRGLPCLPCSPFSRPKFSPAIFTNASEPTLFLIYLKSTQFLLIITYY